MLKRSERTVRASAEWFVTPTQKHADLVVSGEMPLDHATAAVMAALRRDVRARADAGVGA